MQQSGGCFVTGTDTGVGKTVVAAIVAAAAVQRGQRVAVFKAAVSGLAGATAVPPDHLYLRRACNSAQSEDEVAPYRFQAPASPHLAARLEGTTIEPGQVLRAWRHAVRDTDFVVCEGVGGLLVPLTSGYLVRDLAAELGYPIVVVARSGLGTINHTLLTLEATRAIDLEPACVVLNRWPEAPGDLELSNRETIAELGRVPVSCLPTLPARVIERPSPEALAPYAERYLNVRPPIDSGGMAIPC